MTGAEYKLLFDGEAATKDGDVNIVRNRIALDPR